MSRSRPFLAVATLATAGATMLTTLVPADVAAAATTKRPDLTTSAVAPSTTTVQQGKAFTVTHTVVNRGRAKAPGSETRFYLSTHASSSLKERAASRTNPRLALGDVLLGGVARVPAVAPRTKSKPVRTTVRVPVGTPPGVYDLLACADDRGTVTESAEAGNCTSAGKRRIRVTAVPGSDTLRLEQFADSYVWPDDEQAGIDRAQLFCQAITPPKAFSLPAALASVRAFLTREAGPDALSRLQRSGLASTGPKAQELALTAVADANPGLALASLLEAHRLEPRNGTHLVNTAALATSVGLPNEAIAFLDAAASRDVKRSAFGLNQQATAAVVRGNALVLTGRHSAAASLYRTAQRLEPLLSEADTGLATVEACAGREDAAAWLLRKSRQRDDAPRTGAEDRPEPAVDATRGQVSPIRHLPLAQSTGQLVRLRPTYQRIAAGFTGEIDRRNAEDDELSQRLRDAEDRTTDAELERRRGILLLTYRVNQEPRIRALLDAFHDRLDEPGRSTASSGARAPARPSRRTAG